MIILQRRVHEGVFKAEAEVVVNDREVEVQNQMTNFSSEDEEEFDNEAVIGHVLLTDSEVSDCMTCPVTPLFQWDPSQSPPNPFVSTFSTCHSTPITKAVFVFGWGVRPLRKSS
uniref:Uncharacterized protein n=1 Tax=Tanacetum cinerariifolium TaxID=118510 RepID=A0A6L2J6C0_TANCI|nr:hypothetical protein [Tanacetum cinerariifolium]